MAHRVRRHEWIDGVLQTFDHFFGSKEEAVKFANESTSQLVKVYDAAGQIIHSVESSTETYA
jgi:hypothetical protein